MMTPIKSPCIQVCEVNADGLCSGCFRTTDEIGRWVIISEEERDKIMQSLPARQADYLASCFD